MPTNPVSSPATRRAVGCSSGNTTMRKARVLSGVAALMIAASTVGTCCRPNANRVNGTAFCSAAYTTRCRHTDARRGRPTRSTTASAPRVSAPSARRQNVTWTGLSAPSPTRMNANDEPHIRALARYAGSQVRAGDGVAVGAALTPRPARRPPLDPTPCP